MEYLIKNKNIVSVYEAKELVKKGIPVYAVFNSRTLGIISVKVVEIQISMFIFDYNNLKKLYGYIYKVDMFFTC